MELIEFEVTTIQFPDLGGGAPVVILKEKEGDRELPIVIGISEAQSIKMALDNFKVPRPQTHDLIKQIFEALDLKLLRIVINDLKDNTYYARLVIFDESKKTLYSIDARPSDSIAIAIRFNAPIFVSSYVLKKAFYLEEGF